MKLITPQVVALVALEAHAKRPQRSVVGDESYDPVLHHSSSSAQSYYLNESITNGPPEGNPEEASAESADEEATDVVVRKHEYNELFTEIHDSVSFDNSTREQGLRGFNGYQAADLPCPKLPELPNMENPHFYKEVASASGPRPPAPGPDGGFEDTCDFPGGFENNPEYFERVYKDCNGNPIKGNKKWYRSRYRGFVGKRHTFYHQAEGTFKYGQARRYCEGIDTVMPDESKIWCPSEQRESRWMWHHHPAQPFGPYPDTLGLWTGIWWDNDDKQHTCGKMSKNPQTYFNWFPVGGKEPTKGNQKTVYLRHINIKMMDVNGENMNYYANLMCEMNCPWQTCNQLDCSKKCVDNGTEAPYCACEAEGEEWDEETQSCKSEWTEIDVPVADAVPILLEQMVGLDKADELMMHGCHCSKFLGVTKVGGMASLDDADEICKTWRKKRKCITLEGGNCFGKDTNYLTYKARIHYQTKEIDCSAVTQGDGSCEKDACTIDALYASFLFQQSMADGDNWSAIVGTDESCPRCEGGCEGADRCVGTAPNVNMLRGP